jgi:hypothetical protein
MCGLNSCSCKSPLLCGQHRPSYFPGFTECCMPLSLSGLFIVSALSTAVRCCEPCKGIQTCESHCPPCKHHCPDSCTAAVFKRSTEPPSGSAISKRWACLCSRPLMCCDQLSRRRHPSCRHCGFFFSSRVCSLIQPVCLARAAEACRRCKSGFRGARLWAALVTALHALGHLPDQPRGSWAATRGVWAATALLKQASCS